MDLNGQWTKAGELNQARDGHNVMYDGQYLMVVGGGPEGQTEKCTLADGLISCTSQNPLLYLYVDYPEIFLVSDDFCRR